MAGTASIIHNLTTSGDPAPQIGDSLPISVNYSSGLVYRLEDIVIADDYGNATLWAANGGLSTFQFGLIQSDEELLLELKNDKVTPEYVLITVPSNVPVYFGGTDRAGTSAFISSGQITGLGNIVQIKVQRNVADAVGDATVQLMLFK